MRCDEHRNSAFEYTLVLNTFTLYSCRLLFHRPCASQAWPSVQCPAPLLLVPLPSSMSLQETPERVDLLDLHACTKACSNLLLEPLLSKFRQVFPTHRQFFFNIHSFSLPSNPHLGFFINILIVCIQSSITH